MNESDISPFFRHNFAQNKKAEIQLLVNQLFSGRMYPKPESNRHGRNGQRILSPSCLPISPFGRLKKNLHVSNRRFFLSRAENETRTRDPDLGKVVLYQLSYFRSINRFGCANIHTFFISKSLVSIFSVNFLFRSVSSGLQRELMC